MFGDTIIVFTSKVKLPVESQEIIDFSDVDILSWLTTEIGDTFVDTEETDLVTGDGTKKAKGFFGRRGVSCSV